MTDIGTIAIVGAGLAGAKAAEALRTDGYDGRIALYGEEPQRPYLRPPLSKEYTCAARASLTRCSSIPRPGTRTRRSSSIARPG